MNSSLPTLSSTSSSTPSSMPAAFTHRALLGWISEFVNRPLSGVWPQIPLDDATLADFDAYFDLCRASGYNEVSIWGFFVDRSWPLDIASCMDNERRARVERVLQSAHDRGLHVLSGLGIYSWGFDAIIEAHPDLSRDNRQVLCASEEAAWPWMKRVIDFVMGEFDFDGLAMQSADNGRCTCEACRDLSTVAYHAALNERVAGYVNERWPSKCLVMDNWGCPFSDPADLPRLVELSHHLCYLMDHNNSAMERGDNQRRKLIAGLQCPYGTLAGRSAWPPQRWPRHKWFVPTTLSNVAYVRQLYSDGGRAAEQFVTTLENPSGEITLRFMGKLLANVDADPETLLREAVELTYEPKDAATLDGLVEVVRGAEEAFFRHARPELATFVGLFYLDGGLMHSQEPNPTRYLEEMSAANRAAYAQAIEALGRTVDQLRTGVGAQAKIALTSRALQTVCEDAHAVAG